MLQRIEHHARLDARDLVLRIDAQHVIEILRHVHHDGDVAALTSKAGPPATGKDGSAMGPAYLHGRDDIVDVAWQHDADGHLPIIGTVGGVERPAAAVEAHFASHDAAEIAGKILVKCCDHLTSSPLVRGDPRDGLLAGWRTAPELLDRIRSRVRPSRLERRSGPNPP